MKSLILADNDASGAGSRAAEAIASKLKAEGRKVAICMPPEPDTDFNDLLMSEGRAAVAALVRAALANLAEAPRRTRHRPASAAWLCAAITTTAAAPIRRRRSLPRRQQGLVADPRLQSSSHGYFAPGGLLSWVVPDDRGQLVAAPVTDERLRYMLARLAVWQKINRNSELVPAPPPTGLVKSLLATPDPALPVLAGIVNTPVFGSDGTLLTAARLSRGSAASLSSGTGLRASAHSGASIGREMSQKPGRCFSMIFWATFPS